MDTGQRNFNVQRSERSTPTFGSSVCMSMKNWPGQFRHEFQLRKMVQCWAFCDLSAAVSQENRSSPVRNWFHTSHPASFIRGGAPIEYYRGLWDPRALCRTIECLIFLFVLDPFLVLGWACGTPKTVG